MSSAAVREFPLSILDQTMLRMYVRQLIIFPFPDPKHSEDALRALRTAFVATLVQYPFLAGTVAPSDERKDRLTLQYPEPIPEALVDQIFTSTHDVAEDQDFDYEKMGRRGFSPSGFPADMFCPKLLRNHPGLDEPTAAGLISFTKGHSVPVLATQAAFIPGGLVLSVYSNHSVVDGNGIAQIYRVWSANTQSRTQTNTSDIVALEAERRLFDILAESDKPIDCPEVRDPGTSPRSPALRSVPYNLAAKLFIFSASTVSNLTATLSSVADTRISSFTALVSLLWTHITLARSSSLHENNIQKTTLCMAFDHRKNLAPHIKQSYIGNCATGITASVPLDKMLPQHSSPTDAHHLAPIALGMANTLSSITLDWLKARLSRFARTSNAYQLGMDVDIVNGPDVFVTSWMHMGADCVWNVPGVTSETPVAIRKPQSNVESYIHILPRSGLGVEDRAYEILVCLEEGEIERVAGSLERDGWVERVIPA